MKTSTKILFIVIFLSLVGCLLFIPDLISRFIIMKNGGGLKIDAYFYIEMILSTILQLSITILFVRFINSLRLTQKLFFSIIPLTFSFGAIIFSIININTIGNSTVQSIASVLNINKTNSNNILWAIVLSILYIIIMIITLWLSCRPLNKVSKAVERLSDGKVRNNITIGGSKQFKDIEHGLNKINENYKIKENLIKATNNEYQKYIPKQFLKYLGKSSILELESGNQVKKDVTTLFCDIRNSTSTSLSLSLEDNFKYINSYIKTISPIIRKSNGFIDKFLGDGILAVFPTAKDGVECANNIVKAVKSKNTKNNMFSADIGISIHTGEVVFGVVGEEARKSPTIISDSVNYASKMERINKEFGSTIVFSKSTLNALPSSYPIAYRYVAVLNVEGSPNSMSVFENLEIYDKTLRNKLITNKAKFETGVKEFYSQNYQKAKTCFEEVYKKEKEDSVCYIYFNKCEKMIKNVSN